MTEKLFWGCIAMLAYLYLGFPLILLARGRFRARPYRIGDETPSVSVIVAARNEAPIIAERVENLLALDYPPDRLEVLIASDGSDDATNEIVGRYANGRVRLLALPRVGKEQALNEAFAESHGEVLVFSDANSMFGRDAVRALVGPLADPAVGGVAGNQVYLPEGGGDASVVGEQQYWSFDRTLKIAQSRAGSVTGATGAIYALRRALFRPLRAGVQDDFHASLRVIEQGYRLVFAPGAVAYEHVPTLTTAETFSRRSRIMVRGFRCVVTMRKLLNPLRYGFFSIQLLTHKLLLQTAFVPLALIAVTTGLLWDAGLVYRAAAIAQAVLYALALVGVLLVDRPLARRKPFALPVYFCVVYAASAKAVWSLFRGDTAQKWEPERSLRSTHDQAA